MLSLIFLVLCCCLCPSQVTVLPPGEWDPSIRIEPPDAVPSQDKRLESAKSGFGGGGEEHDPAEDREEALAKTGRSGEFTYNRIVRLLGDRISGISAGMFDLLQP